MSLPVGQQHILDAMADGLRRTEPKLSGMYAVFTRLCAKEGPPRREQIPELRRPKSSALMAGIPGRPVTRSRQAWRLVLVAYSLAIALALLAMLVVVASRPAACGQATQHQPATDARSWCRPETQRPRGSLADGTLDTAIMMLGSRGFAANPR